MVWDRMFGTYMPFLIEGRGGGMLQVRAPSLDYRRINK
jgi:sphinganine C4-monooxygenase